MIDGLTWLIPHPNLYPPFFPLRHLPIHPHPLNQLTNVPLKQSVIDLATLYPPALTPAVSTSLRTYYITSFGDRFFTAPPAWFRAYMYLEALYHLPVSLWFVWNIPRGHPLIGLNLLVFALETAVTTLTCVVDTAEWAAYSRKQRNDIYSLYVPYLVLAGVMGVDAFFRVKAQLLRAAASGVVDGKAKRT
ncbi:uncharacterized protein A1O9_04513 [Exophiala aquamarina CBS 119918]|uniref:EXPERA domain-containing protein n=1 Tax=Exophiala aquamarina CBS 119918 TaxID=1182545 RepID=A0A072PIU1_9EURO|nr:uncharacterized protein A1O9_04513 [Exophiala aquamarina CBS 119918]KEF59667.1 hypothetical protein A1O9_04513 [Exophiala aquamarina CBS 119918]